MVLQSLVHKNQIKHLETEKSVLVESSQKWVPQIYKTFKDKKYLYLVMEYMPGGDLMNLFIKKDVLSEEESKFYIAEILIAIEYMHKHGVCHRDLKPHNILCTKGNFLLKTINKFKKRSTHGNRKSILLRVS